MKRRLLSLGLFVAITHSAIAAGDDDYKPGPDSLPQPGVPKGEMLNDKYVAKESSVFPGTEREYQIYLPAGLDASKPAPFMVFQDGVIYQAPVVFDNLIAKKEIPPLIGIFIKPGVVPAANENALPRFNRSYEYDSVTDTYSRFLIEEFLPAIKEKHKLKLSDDPNARGIAGSSSGGICAFMVAWHRPDQFRRVFTSVGTYVGIHGADQLAVLVRKHEPKPLRIHLQSGEGDNNLYCGDWWMANQMMERSLTWNGYDVSHTWGTGGHNQKHATAIFPDVLRGLWKGYPEEAVKANPRGDSKWRGYEIVDGESRWEHMPKPKGIGEQYLSANKNGQVLVSGPAQKPGLPFWILDPDGHHRDVKKPNDKCDYAFWTHDNQIAFLQTGEPSRIVVLDSDGTQIKDQVISPHRVYGRITLGFDGSIYFPGSREGRSLIECLHPNGEKVDVLGNQALQPQWFVFSPDQTTVWWKDWEIAGCARRKSNGEFVEFQMFFSVMPQYGSDNPWHSPEGLCVDAEGRVYFPTPGGLQVCDQVGRVNFILELPKRQDMEALRASTGVSAFATVTDICFGGKDLTDIIINCGGQLFKLQTKAHGYISGQMAPIKPPPPKL